MDETFAIDGLINLCSRNEDAIGTLRSSSTRFFFSVTPSCSETGSQILLICLLWEANVRLSSLLMFARDLLNVCSSFGENWQNLTDSGYCSLSIGQLLNCA